MLLDVLRILISAMAVLALALASDLWPWPQRSRSWLWGLVLWFRRWPHHFIKVHIQCIAAHRAINLFLSVQCSAWTEYKFRSVCLHVCVCPSHFLSTRLQVRPHNGVLQLIA